MSTRIFVHSGHCGDKKMDDILHAFDVFESYKAFAVVESFDLTLKPDVTADKAVEDMVRILTTCNRRIVAVFIPGDQVEFEAPLSLCIGGMEFMA